MTPGHTISIVPTVAHVEVRLGGRLLATTDRAMKLDETGCPPATTCRQTTCRWIS